MQCTRVIWKLRMISVLTVRKSLPLYCVFVCVSLFHITWEVAAGGIHIKGLSRLKEVFKCPLTMSVGCERLELSVQNFPLLSNPSYHRHEDVLKSRHRRDTKNPDLFKQIREAISDDPDSSCSSTTFVDTATYDVVHKSPENSSDRLCVWSFSTKQGRRLSVAFREFNLTQAACDQGAQLKILEADHPESTSWSVYAKFCGLIRPFWVLTVSNALKMAFQDVPLSSRGSLIYEVSSECGGKLYGPNGVIDGEDALSPHNSSCEWIITVRAGHVVQLKFEAMNLVDDEICSKFYLLIRDGKTDRAPYLGQGKYCGNELPVLAPSSGRHIFIKLQRDWRDLPPSPVFRLQYSEIPKELSSIFSYTEQKDTDLTPLICGSNITVEKGSEVVISSPGYPRPPVRPADCDWVITGSVESRLRIDFMPGFEMTSECEHGDRAEFVQVFDGDSPDSRTLVMACGYRSPGSWFSSGNTMRVHFETEAHEPNSGFKAVIREAQSCGGTLTDEKGIISSPNFPDPYEENVECEWFIHSKPRETLNLTFLEMELPDGPDCSTVDHIEIRETGADGILHGHYCGSLTNKTLSIQSIDTSIYVKFKSFEKQGNGRGFQLFYYSRIFNCEEWLHEPEGEISLPLIPPHFPHVRHCEWYIVAKRGKKVTLKFQEFSLKKLPLDGTCLDEFSFTNATVRRQYLPDNIICGDSPPEKIESVGNTMALGLRISAHYTGRKLKALYTTTEDAVCGGDLSGPSGTIQSPNFGSGNYTNDIQCIWTIDVAQGNGNRTLVLNAEHFDLQGSPEYGCPRDFVWIKGKEIEETSTIYDCGGIVHNPNGVIASPGYPDSYPPNMDCHWIFRTSYGKQIQVEFLKFELEDDCDLDYVLLSNGESKKSPIVGRFCGKNSPDSILSESSSFGLVFRSDSVGKAGGFEALVRSVDAGCGGLYQSPYGTISSPGYPNVYPNSLECSWTLQMEPRSGFYMRIRFADLFDIEKDDDSCSKDYLLIEEYVDDDWVAVKRLCGNQTPALYSTFSERIRLTFHTDDGTSGQGFRFSYQWTCGGIYTQKGGIITSPDYPNLYETEMYCNYYILREPNEYITLDFATNNFNITGDPEVHCFDSVTVYEGNSTLDARLGLFCGEQAPETIVSKGSMLIVFQSGSYYRRYGFVASYRVYDSPPTLAATIIED